MRKPNSAGQQKPYAGGLARWLTMAVASLAFATACAQPFEHTMQLDGKAPAEATLEDVSWLVGSWEGEAFGERFEEVWNPASNGSMVGMFKVLQGEDRVNFYELMLLVEEQGSLSLKVKHFGEDFTAWEEKDDMVTFRLVKLQPNAIHFSGLSFYRLDKNRIDGYIAIRNSKGEVREEKLVYRRVANP